MLLTPWLNFFVSLSSYWPEVEKYWISLQVTNSMVKLLFFRFRVTNSRLKNIGVTNSTGAFLFSHLRVTNVKLINEKNSLNNAVSNWHGLRHSITFFKFSLLYCKYIFDIYLSMLDFNGLCKFSNIIIYKITENIQ